MHMHTDISHLALVPENKNADTVANKDTAAIRINFMDLICILSTMIINSCHAYFRTYIRLLIRNTNSTI